MPASPLHPDLLSMLACPKCKGDLTLTGDEKGLICESCKVTYPVRKGVPVMLVEEAVPFRGGMEGGGERSGERAVLSIVEGKNKGEKIEIEKGICRAIGRSLDEAERTKIFTLDSAISLDDSSKKLVMQFVSKQFRGRTSARKDGEGEAIGGFLRGPDFQIRDLAVSRLHAMIFCDESGAVGILDLVSRNGTFVNGAEVESKILKKGDLIAMGGTKIRFES